MQLTTKTFVTALLAAAAQEAVAAPQRGAQAAGVDGDATIFTIQTVGFGESETASSSTPITTSTSSATATTTLAGAIPPEELAAIQSSAAAAASSAAEANERAAQSGLRPLPGLQTADGGAGTLRPLPGLNTDNLNALPTATDSLVLTDILALPTEVASVSLRPLPGLDAGASAGQPLLPLPGLSTLTSVLPSIETSIIEIIPTPSAVIGTFTQIVGGFTTISASSADVIETPPAEVLPTSTLDGVIGSFTPIVGVPTTTAVIPDPAAGAPSSEELPPSFATPSGDLTSPDSTASADLGSGDVVQPTAGLDVPADIPADASSTLQTLPGLNTDAPVTDSLTPLPGLPTDSAVEALPTDSLAPLPGLDTTADAAVPTDSLTPLPGLDSTATDSLESLPTDTVDSSTSSSSSSSSSSSTDFIAIDTLTDTTPPATGTGLVAIPTSSVLTTLTTVNNGVTQTLTTSVAAVATGVGLPSASPSTAVVEAGAMAAYGSKSGAVLAAVVAGLVGVVGLLM